MFEARLAQGSLLKKILEAVKDLVNDANFDCSPTSISLQAMDSSHVSLVHLLLRSEGFEQFRCDRQLSLGIKLANMAKILKCAGNDDSITLSAPDDGDTCTFMFESKEGDKVSQFELKLMEIDSEHLGIPDTEYEVNISMSSGEFQRICRDLAVIGDTVQINASKEGVEFSASGDIGGGSITVRPHASADNPAESTTIQLDEPLKLTFSLRFLNIFTKATALSSQVNIKMSKDVPLVVEYKIESMGNLSFFLAPKIDDEEESGE